MKVHQHVLSLCHLDEDGEEICRPGDRGTVIHVEADGVPLVRFTRTGRATIVDPDTEVVRSRGEVRATC